MALQGAPGLTGSAPKYADIVRDHARRRWQVAAGADLVERARKGEPTGDIIERLTAAEAHAGADELELEDMAAALADDREDIPTVLARNDGVHLLYPAAVNVIQSEPSLGKSWIALMAVVQVLVAGGVVLYLDYEDAPRRIVRRLVNLGVPEDVIIDRFHYKRPGPLSSRGLAHLPRLAARLNADFVVIDGVADAMAMQGHEENEAAGVLAWWTTVPRPLSWTGACVLLLDHVTKSTEGRNRWARGSGAKLGAVDGAAYQLESISPLSKHEPSKLRLTISKDRHGYIGAVGEAAADIDITPHDEGRRLTWETTPVTRKEDSEWEGPTNCMEAVMRLFQDHPAELSRSNVPTQLKAVYGSSYRRETIYVALTKLVRDGLLRERPGAKNGLYYSLASDPATAPADTLDLPPERTAPEF